MRILLTILTAASLTGCLTTGGVREVQTDPPGARLVIENYGECETPCTVKLSRERKARIAKAGYVTREVMIGPGGGRLIFPLELAAATDNVDAETLPDLD